MTRVYVGVLLVLAASSATVEAQGTIENTVQPFLKANCVQCHNAQRATSGLNLDEPATAALVAQNRERWETILQKISSGEMPPKGAPRPSDADRAAVTGSIEAEFDRADRSAPPDPGRVTARRLNRAEYNYTVSDLLGVDFRPADDFPQDDTGYGFDNNGDVLSLSIVADGEISGGGGGGGAHRRLRTAVGQARHGALSAATAGAARAISTTSSSIRARISPSRTTTSPA